MIEYMRGINNPPFVGPRVFVEDCPNLLTSEHCYKYLNLPTVSTERIKHKGLTRRIIRPSWWAGINGWDEGFVVAVRDDGTIFSISTVCGTKGAEYNQRGVCIRKRDDNKIIYDRVEQQQGALCFFGVIVLFFVLVILVGG